MYMHEMYQNRKQYIHTALFYSMVLTGEWYPQQRKRGFQKVSETQSFAKNYMMLGVMFHMKIKTLHFKVLLLTKEIDSGVLD